MQTEDDLRWLHFVRDVELQAAFDYFCDDRGARILEIGSGTGYMLGRIRERYPDAIGLEVEGSAYEFSEPRISLYDGRSIPFPDNQFDVVFSSHVLEHVAEIEPFVEEIARVLKPGGTAIHIIPSPTWRVLTSAMHYFAIAKMALSLLLPAGRGPIQTKASGRSKGDLLRFLFYAPRHGEWGNVVTETYYFSRCRWNRIFDASSLKRIHNMGVGLVYWGRDLFRFSLPLGARTVLASLIGSSSNLYVIRKGE